MRKIEKPEPTFWTGSRHSILAGPINLPANGVFTTAATIDGGMKDPPPNGQRVVATLTLIISDAPGTYALGITEATCYTTNGEISELTTPTPFSIMVQGQ